MNGLFNMNIATISKLLLGISLLCNSLHGIMYNGVPISSIVEPDKILSIHPEVENQLLYIEIKDNNISMQHIDISSIPNFKKDSQKLIKKNRILSKIHNSPFLNYIDSHFVEPIQINVKTNSMNFIRCLLESPVIFTKSDRFDFVECFLINPKELYILPDRPDSDIQLMVITFFENSEYPNILHGTMHFNKNNINTSLYLTNVHNVRIQFSNKAFKEQDHS